MTRRAADPATLTRPPMTEKALLACVVEMAQWLGYECYHPWLSVKSADGYPDLTLVNPRQRRVLWIELKSERGRATDSQTRWIAALRGAGAEVHVLRPEDWLTGRVERILTGPPTSEVG